MDVSTPAIFPTLMECLRAVPDPRVQGRCDHPLVEILAIIIVASLAGADDFVAMHDFASGQERWLRDRLGLTFREGIPSHDTLNRTVCLLAPRCVGDLLTQVVAIVARTLPELPTIESDQLAIDGKTLRGTKRTGADAVQRMLVTVSAWSTRAGLTLAQVRAEEKSNEITAIPKLLEILDLSGALVSIDAAGCQKEIASRIVDGEGDYLLHVKGNQERLEADLHALVAAELEGEIGSLKYADEPPEKKAHGRRESRSCLVIDDEAKLKSGIRDFGLWKGLKSVIAVTSVREVDGQVSEELRFYISSRTATAEVFGRAVRQHWRIENQCHWILDVAFREDDHRLRSGNGPENMSTVRKLALMMLKRVKLKRGIKNKRLKAAWDTRFLESILKDFLAN